MSLLVVNPFHCWVAPSLVEVEIVGLLPLVRGGVWFVSLFGRGVCGCLATGLPLGCEAVFERRVRYSIVVTNPPQWRFPRWEIVDWKSYTVV